MNKTLYCRCLEKGRITGWLLLGLAECAGLQKLWESKLRSHSWQALASSSSSTSPPRKATLLLMGDKYHHPKGAACTAACSCSTHSSPGHQQAKAGLALLAWAAMGTHLPVPTTITHGVSQAYCMFLWSFEDPEPKTEHLDRVRWQFLVYSSQALAGVVHSLGSLGRAHQRRPSWTWGGFCVYLPAAWSRNMLNNSVLARETALWEIVYTSVIGC